MLARSPERRTAVLVETPLPGSIKGTVQKNKSELIKQRAPFRRTIKFLHEKLVESINLECSHTFLKRKMVECELAWEQCRNIDRLLLEIMEQQEEEEAASKEEYAQLDYQEKIYELREAYEKYLEKRKTEPSSVAGDVKDTKEAAREIAKPVEKAVKENSETIDPMENTHYTKSTEKVHIGREPFQSTVKGNRPAAEEAMGEDWIRQLASPTLKEPKEVTVLAQKPFSGKLPDQKEGVDRKDYIENHPKIDTTRPYQDECPICRKEHRVQKCFMFREADRVRKKKLIKEYRLCFCCLEKGHIGRVCRVKKRCGKDGCNRVHHPELHEDVEQNVNYQVRSKELASEIKVRSYNVNQGTNGTALGVVSVRVRNVQGRFVTARALVDEGSDTSFASRAFVRRLGFTGKRRKLKIVGVSRESKEEAEQQSLTVKTGTNQDHLVNVWSLSKLCEKVKPMDWSRVQARYKHLEGLPLKTPPGPIDLLIGMDHPELLVPSEIRRGEANEPYALRTELGWVARGRVTEEIPQAQVFATHVRQKSKKELTKGGKGIIPKIAQRKQIEDRKVNPIDQKMKRSMTERKVGNRVIEMQRKKPSKISNRKYDQPVDQDGHLWKNKLQQLE